MEQSGSAWHEPATHADPVGQPLPHAAGRQAPSTHTAPTGQVSEVVQVLVGTHAPSGAQVSPARHSKSVRHSSRERQKPSSHTLLGGQSAATLQRLRPKGWQVPLRQIWPWPHPLSELHCGGTAWHRWLTQRVPGSHAHAASSQHRARGQQ